MNGPDLRTSFGALITPPKSKPQWEPLAWQWALLNDWLLKGALPDAVDIPTGLGKTAVMALWLLALAAQIHETGTPKLPRRLIYVVDRRAVVDQATTEAEKLRENLATAPELAWMRDAFGLVEGEKLPVSTLRGQLADNREWLADPARPAIIVGTVDMIGSRLLFSGYGVSRRMRPYHAGLLGVDTLVLLDEAHLVPAFQRLLEAIDPEQKGSASPWHTGTLWPETTVIRPLRVLPLSATQRDGGPSDRKTIFTLTSETRTDAITQQRLQARKALELRAFEPGKKEDDALAEALMQAAQELLENEDGGLKPRHLLIYCDKRKVAEKLHDELHKEWVRKSKLLEKDRLELFTGARRVFERTKAAANLKDLGFIAGKEAPEPEKPAILIATSAAEVGVDLDADDLICDLVPLERMIQRFGRVNRRGEQDDTRIIVLHPDPLPKKARHAEQLPAALEALRKLNGDASPQALRDFATQERELVRQASTPEPLHPPFPLAVVESWALTNITEHPGRPDIQPWLRGWVEDDQPQAEILWRAFLPWPEGDAPKEKEVNAFFASARPHLLEVLETDVDSIAKMLVTRAKKWSGEGLGILLLNRRNELEKYLSMEELKAMKPADLKELIAFRRVVAPAALGGLSESGLLASNAANPVKALDTIEEETWQQAVGFRVRKESVDKVSGNDWRIDYRFNPKPDSDEEEGGEKIIVEVWRGGGEAPLLGDPAITRMKQKLRDHLNDVAQKAEELADKLNLPDNMREALILSARLHDLGKAHRIWQKAMNGNLEDPLAKSTGGNTRMLAGFRHEFASILDVTLPENIKRFTSGVHNELASELREQLNKHTEEERNLILHLVAAHHGFARPLMPDIDNTLPPSAVKPHVQAIALRFAMLQKRFGPWGLAWLETLLRAADQRASACLDASNAPETKEASHG
ncbi:type I-U CRISPR-associated helicase/endonuclease Cas3 [Thermopetrobacter sp. TC1]|uniref:type I-G CRISPR-associated helicase/endonuclease Cas3g n=1 Tax=Thermopetrobacter sp. TC1 TaxID=1495045 RepID=UPI000B1F397D|nr:type I-U CRISPR-associated helicase/endonuclease Cas3 [Thermopetrobacter sp. TC1]